MNGKGDKPRPMTVTNQQYSDNWDSVFGKPPEVGDRTKYTPEQEALEQALTNMGEWIDNNLDKRLGINPTHMIVVKSKEECDAIMKTRIAPSPADMTIHHSDAVCNPTSHGTTTEDALEAMKIAHEAMCCIVEGDGDERVR